MLEYIFFNDAPRSTFIQYLVSQDIPYGEVDDSMMGKVVTVPEGLGEDVEEQMEARYDELMENSEELLAETA